MGKHAVMCRVMFVCAGSVGGKSLKYLMWDY